MPNKPALVLTPVARDRVIERLQDHYARNELLVEDFERRVEQAEDATTTKELEAALAGLPVPPEAALAPAERAGQLTRTMSVVLGSASQRGRWRVPSRLVVKAYGGSAEVDLSEAELSGEVDLEVRAVFGSVLIVVPEGLAVEVLGGAVLGSFDHLVQPPATTRDKRRLRITGRAVFGSVEIEVRKRPGLLQAMKDTVRGLLGP